MSEQLQVQKHKHHEELPEIEELPEEVDESKLIALADLVLRHIDETLTAAA